MGHGKKPMRRWVIWMIIIIWSASAITVFIANQIHPTAVVNATLTVSEIPVMTETQQIVASSREDELLVTRVESLQVEGVMQASINGNTAKQLHALNINGDVAASCTFYAVRSDALRLTPPTLVTLAWIEPRPEHSSDLQSRHAFALISHRPLSGNLTSQPSEPNSNARAGFTCTRMHGEGAQANSTFDVEFSPQGGDSIHFSTLPDARVDFRPNSNSEISDTTISAVGELRFSKIDPASDLEKTVLLQPPPDRKNSLNFEKLDKKIDLDFGDLLVIRPGKEFYIRQFTVDNGVQLSLHGPVKELQVGAGPKDLTSRMPSLLDRLVHDKEYYALIPALAAALIGILEKMGVLPGK